ncbi:MAG: hypothetical protein ACLSHN_11345 [Eubacterium sp.]|uniref:hypothetical protein n=1 Tax=Eubacterium sp. TaxID=142586 RepID=UPI003992D54F
MKKTTLRLLLFSFCMSFLMLIPAKVNAEEIVPVTISVKYGQTEARKILDMINELRTSPYDAWAWDITDETRGLSRLKELVYDYDLERLAMKRAKKLHYPTITPAQMVKVLLLFIRKKVLLHFAGENIATGSPNVYSSAEAVNRGWREDAEP